MIDVLICAMPLMHDLERVPAAPAMLKAAAQKVGYTATTIDFNLEYFINQCNRNIDVYYDLGCVWRPYDSITELADNSADIWAQQCIQTIERVNPKSIAISVFTNWQHRSTWRLLQSIRHAIPSLPIIIGGFGCEITAASLNGVKGVGRLDQIKPFWQLVTEKKLADYVALGAGGSLDEFVSFLDRILTQNNRATSTVEENAIYDAPIPDYTDYKFDQYIWKDKQSLAVTGSKGCVRACTFCDIPGAFGRFKYRRGQDIADEMIHQHARHGVQYFEFTDSLVNGSFKAFREWLTILAAYNDARPKDKHIRWFGQYICRPQTQIPLDIYDLMRRSGVSRLVIGVESGSNDVLEAMKKKMTVEDVYDELDQFSKHDISCEILMISGFYNETYERFVETLHFLQRCQKYLANGTIGNLGMGPPLFINDLMFIGQHAEELGIIINESHDQLWTMASDPDNNYVNRTRRRVVTQLVLDLLGYPLSSQHISNLKQSLALLSRIENQLLEEINEITPTSVV